MRRITSLYLGGPDAALPDSIVLMANKRRLFVVATPDVYGDLTGFEMCLEAVKLYSD